MLDGFFGGSRWATNKTNKQKMEERIKDSVLNMVIDRDQSFLKTARAYDTSIIVNNRDGGIQEFNHDGRRYISFPAQMEQEFEDMKDWEAEEKMDSLIRLCTVNNEFEYEESRIGEKVVDNEKIYNGITGMDTGFDKDSDSPFEYRVGKTDEDNKDDAEEGEDSSTGNGRVGTRGMETESSVDQPTNVKFSGDFYKREYEFEDTDLDVGQEMPTEATDNPFYGEDDYEDAQVSKHRQEILKKLANQIVKSFKGRVSKQRTMIPSKRLVSKSLAVDISEKIYENKKGDSGKHLKLNLIIDMSGSMAGTPVVNAIEMIYIFNEIAAKGYLTGSVIWSETGSRCTVKFPMPREFVLKMQHTGGGEGLGKNLQHFKDELKRADANICMTDGQLTGDPILKGMYAKEKIDIIGVYVNKHAKDLTEYTGSLERWFTRSLVRHTTEELCEKLIQFSLRKKK